jgi:Fe-S-cluster containining protein
LKAPAPSRPARDQQLVQILDAALADATRRAGDFLVCRQGCTQCCIGAFAINQLDAARLREGLAELDRSDPNRAARIRQRVEASIERISPDFPGEPAIGILCESKRAQRKFEDFANDEPCPVLDPQTGTCDLYAHRPLTCRLFGPPVRAESSGQEDIPQNRTRTSVKAEDPPAEVAFGICELCFHGATSEQIAACEIHVDTDGLELELLRELGTELGAKSRTIVAFALASSL